MGKNKKKIGVVYSTNPDYQYNYDEPKNESAPSNDQQNLRVMIDRKARKGKAVTLITGYQGSTNDIENLGKWLKKKCGVGGAVKNREILIQGDHKKKVIDMLIKEGYTNTKGVGGG